MKRPSRSNTHLVPVAVGGGGGGWGALAPPIVTKGGLSHPNQKKDNLDPDKYRNSCSPLVAL